jgi:hypothetical protein
MDLSADLSFPADPATVAAMLVDPDYVRERCERTTATNVEVDVREDGGATVVTSERTYPTDGFPSIARSFVGDGLRIRQVDRWSPAGDGSWTGTSTVDSPGLPAGLKAITRLEATDGGSREVVRGEVKASIPLVGGKLERLVHEQVLRALAVEEQVAAEWLNGTRP